MKAQIVAVGIELVWIEGVNVNICSQATLDFRSSENHEIFQQLVFDDLGIGEFVVETAPLLVEENG